MRGDGSWTAVETNVELAYASISVKYALTTTMTAIPGLSVTFATTTRPVMLEAYLGQLFLNATGNITWQLYDSTTSTVLLESKEVYTSSNVVTDSGTIKVRIPASTASRTYVVRAAASVTTNSPQANGYPYTAYIQAVQV